MNKRTNQEIVDDHFSKHIVEERRVLHEARPRLEYMRWGQPGTINCRIDYLMKDSTLIVTGDLGFASYCWYGKPLTLEWVAGCNLDYFHGKCEASELGQNIYNYEWDADKARKYIFQMFRNYHDCKGYKKYKDSSFPNNIDGKEEFQACFYTEDPYDIFGDDWWSWAPTCGQVIPGRTRLHLFGLKKAFGKEIK